MKKQPENPNDHKAKTPNTKGREGQARAFTSYDNAQKDTSSPQKVRESQEPTAQQQRLKHSRDEEQE
jgi:hypothetical protein